VVGLRPAPTYRLEDQTPATSAVAARRIVAMPYQSWLRRLCARPASDGHGTWTHKGGQTYDQRFVSMINFATAPGPAARRDG
jgi:hypothetical protein